MLEYDEIYIFILQDTHENAKQIKLGEEAVIMSEFVADQLLKFSSLFKAPSQLVSLKDEAVRIKQALAHKSRIELEKELDAKRIALENELLGLDEALNEGDATKIVKKRGRPKKNSY